MESQSDDSDLSWQIDGLINNWMLPRPAPYPLRLPVIRNVRAIILSYQVLRHEDMVSRVGLGFPTGYDQWVLYAIRRGWC